MRWDFAYNAWIGLHDRRMEHVFEWEDGTRLDYENWISKRVGSLYNEVGIIQTMLYKVIPKYLYTIIIFLEYFCK